MQKELLEHWAKIGMGTINLDEGVLIFEKLLKEDSPHIGVMPTDWSKYPDQNSFFEALKELENKNEQKEQSEVLLELKQADPAQRRKMLVKYVESEICTILGYEKGKQSFEEDQGFFELGMNSLTAIEFSIPVEFKVSLMIYDLMGREVRTLINSNLKPGYHKVFWNGTDHFGKLVASGMYFTVMQSGDFRDVRKMVLLK